MTKKIINWFFMLLMTVFVGLLISCSDDPTSPAPKNAVASFSITGATSTGGSNYQGTAPVTIYTTNSSTDATTYLWDFGDGFTTTNASPSHTYATPGSYTIRLSASNAIGSNSTEKLLKVLQAPHWVLQDSSTFSLTAGYVRSIGDTNFNSYTDSPAGYKFVVSASSGVTIEVVPNQNEYHHYMNSETFNYYASLEAIGVTTYTQRGNISKYNIILIHNKNLLSSITVTRKVYTWSAGTWDGITQ